MSAILDLLTGDAGTLIQQANIEGDTTLGPDDPPRWRWERQGKKPTRYQSNHSISRPAGTPPGASPNRPKNRAAAPPICATYEAQLRQTGPCRHPHNCATYEAQLCHLPVFEYKNQSPATGAIVPVGKSGPRHHQRVGSVTDTIFSPPEPLNHPPGQPPQSLF